MGTETRFINISFVASEQELLARWRILQTEDQYERGHDVYQGALTTARLSVSRKTFKTYKEAVAFAHEAEIDKGYAEAYKYGEGVGFPRTKADAELGEKIKAMQKEMDFFHTDILRRFLDSKSSSKKCAHCESIISKKSRKNVLATEARFARTSEQRMYGLVTDCPACGDNLLVTDTDKKRLASLTERHGAATKKYDAAFTVAKNTASAWGYYIVAAVPS